MFVHFESEESVNVKMSKQTLWVVVLNGLFVKQFQRIKFQNSGLFFLKKGYIGKEGLRQGQRAMAQKMTHTNIGLTLEGNQCSSLPFVILTCKRCVTEWSKCNLFKKCPNVALLFEV